MFFKKKKEDNKVEVHKPVKGNNKELSSLNDEMFKNEMMGATIAIDPTDGTIISPIDGEVVTIFPTKHALGLKTSEGIEVLIHVGIDTVKLKGEGFESFVKDGDKVSKGDKLLECDFDLIRSHDYDPAVLVVITNDQEYKCEKIQSDDVIFTLTK